MLEKSFSIGKNGRNYFQFNTARQLQAAESKKYLATTAAYSSRYYLKSHSGSVLNIYEGAMQSSLMESFSKVMKKRMP